MKNTRLFLGMCLALAGVALSQPSAAFSLGRLRGPTVLGQALEVFVPIQASVDEDLVGMCVAADVYYGDSAVEFSKVTVRTDTAVGGVSTIRISARKPVDEPVVTVYLRIGCQTQSSRKYVLLSEYSTEVATLPTVGEIVGLGPQIVGTPKNSETALASSESRYSENEPVKGAKRKGDPGAAKEPIKNAVVERRNVSTSPALARGKSDSKGDVSRRGPRLKLQPLDISESWEPALRMSNELIAMPTDADTGKRANAAALWRALNSSPDDVLQSDARRTALEKEFTNLSALSRANQLALAEMDAKLKSAQDSRLTNPVVYTLLGLLLGCGAIIGFVFRQQRQSHDGGGMPWWTERGLRNDVSVGAHQQSNARVHSADDISPDREERPVGLTPKSSVMRSADVDIRLADSGFPPDAVQGSVSKARETNATKPTDFGHSVIGALRAINTQEMVDVRQQADFFLALGQHDEAIGLLYGALNQTSEANPHIYLDLIGLLHKLSRKEEYEKVRLAFNALYTCHLPSYGEYSEEGHGLLEYRGLCDPLVKLWPSRSALGYLEQCLVREPTDSPESGVDLAAFRELLLLHGVLGLLLVDDQTLTNHDEIERRVLPRFQQLPTANAAPTHHQTSAGHLHVDLDLS
jgi:hypothetical protein